MRTYAALVILAFRRITEITVVRVQAIFGPKRTCIRSNFVQILPDPDVCNAHLAAVGCRSALQRIERRWWGHRGGVR